LNYQPFCPNYHVHLESLQQAAEVYLTGSRTATMIGDGGLAATGAAVVPYTGRILWSIYIYMQARKLFSFTGAVHKSLRKQTIAKARAEIYGLGFKAAKKGMKVLAHSTESQQFVKQVGGEWVQKVMQQRLYPAFKKEPGRYKERNNKSALQICRW
jgi:hypothetical protein